MKLAINSFPWIALMFLKLFGTESAFGQMLFSAKPFLTTLLITRLIPQEEK